MSAVVLLASFAIPTSAADGFKPFKLKTLDGVERKLADILGKATLVVFFFPTCSSCNAAFPEIQKLHDTYGGRGLSMVWINVIPEEERLIADWRTRRGFRVPILLGGGSVQNDYKLVMTPTHYLLDSQGKVLARHAGYTTGDEKTLERQIQQALGIVKKP
jgi:cytochrome c biogenesis protein CcmG, thiol:disulfide interchange protein DsbE